jgi:hypothetical protein
VKWGGWLWKGVGLDLGRDFCIGNLGDKKDPWVVRLIHLHLKYPRPVGTLGFAWTGIETFLQLSLLLHFVSRHGRINMR